jgi:hypothetical protein
MSGLRRLAGNGVESAAATTREGLPGRGREKRGCED